MDDKCSSTHIHGEPLSSLLFYSYLVILETHRLSWLSLLLSKLLGLFIEVSLFFWPHFHIQASGPCGPVTLLQSISRLRRNMHHLGRGEEKHMNLIIQYVKHTSVRSTTESEACPLGQDGDQRTPIICLSLSTSAGVTGMRSHAQLSGWALRFYIQAHTFSQQELLPTEPSHQSHINYFAPPIDCCSQCTTINSHSRVLQLSSVVLFLASAQLTFS